MHDLAADHRHARADIGDFGLRHRQRIGAQHHEVGEPAGLQRTLLVLVERQVGAVGGGAAQCFGTAERLLGRQYPPPIVGRAAVTTPLISTWVG